MEILRPIVATLGYVLHPDGERVLLIHRNARPDDAHLGKYNGLGGKVHTDESPAEGMRREIREETGLTVSAMRFRGTISWPGFGKHGETWLGYLYLVTAFTGTPPARNVEGELSWEPVARLLGGDLPLWPGDRFFLPLVFDADPRPFEGYMPYAEGQPVTWRYERF